MNAISQENIQKEVKQLKKPKADKGAPKDKL
jgi:hypothetical protein